MKRHSTSILALCLFLLLPCLWGCKQKGCIDTTATNYNTSANTDNGTCTYLATFYSACNSPNYTVTVTSASGTSQTATTAVYYQNGNTPNCGDNGNANFTLGLGNYTYNITSGRINVNGTFTIQENTSCNLYPINYAWISFWTANPANAGVTLTGYGQTETFSTSTANAPNCKASGTISFLVPAGAGNTTYSFAASNGTNYSVNLLLNPNDCVVEQF